MNFLLRTALMHFALKFKNMYVLSVIYLFTDFMVLLRPLLPIAQQIRASVSGLVFFILAQLILPVFAPTPSS